MLSIIALCCWATVYADNFGYDYERQSNVNNGFDSTPFAGFLRDSGFQAGPLSSNDYYAPTSSSSEFEKEYYTFSAPEEEFDSNAVNQQFNNDFKSSLRVIFIRNPEHSDIENAAVQLAKTAAEQRTAIYVLKKQADVENLANKLNVINKNDDSAPEVYYVKYRTPADAQNAQHTIRNQYESLGGKSSSHDDVVAPVLNFASQTTLTNNNEPTDLANAYLPVNSRI